MTTEVIESTTLPDISDMSLDDLRRIDNPVLLASMQRVLEAEDDGTHEIVAGFQSAI